MIPKSSIPLSLSFETASQPSLTYGIDRDRKCLAGRIDGLEAVKQAVYGILNTERYQHLIYSWNFGTELDRLQGKRSEYIYSELKRRITDALTQDDRITGVDAFSFTRNRDTVTVQFTVHSVLGNFETEKEVNPDV